ncbi:hypothetical protein QA646_08745 [Rhizobium sp. CB3090]|uniref:hypothetical protein n=1 Tax=Rhizobium sp. CB3090 TaxID=3039156 RepID=UPI0024B2283B|nr:hypothetical protein [Rhizobium sp. CB3090]WFU10910.1 hypothetical protein QA646_08745 [Rhizobium sp. CB3090]
MSPTKLAQLPKLSSFAGSQYVKITCTWCRITHLYEPEDLIKLFGDVPLLDIERQFRCEGCGRKDYLDARLHSPLGADAIGLTIRQLVEIRMVRRPVWKDVKR